MLVVSAHVCDLWPWTVPSPWLSFATSQSYKKKYSRKIENFAEFSLDVFQIIGVFFSFLGLIKISGVFIYQINLYFSFLNSRELLEIPENGQIQHFSQKIPWNLEFSRKYVWDNFWTLQQANDVASNWSLSRSWRHTCHSGRQVHFYKILPFITNIL